MTEVKNDYIEEVINNLIPTLGVKEFIDHQKLIDLIKLDKVKDCIKAIASYLGLPIDINILYVPKGYQANIKNGFKSSHLVETDGNGKGRGGITAQVSIPSNLPLYGTSSLINFPIDVRLSEDCAENPTTLISVMAHELSHILLYSMWYKEKENEFYTDLTAMILGFGNVMKNGRKVVKTSTSINFGSTITNTETTTYGYLSDDNFEFALDKIRGILSKYREEKNIVLKKFGQINKQLNKTKKMYFYFENYFCYLDKNLNKKITQDDGNKISIFHQPGYHDNFKASIKKYEIIIENGYKLVKNIRNYSAQNIEMMKKYNTELDLNNGDLIKQFDFIRNDVDILKKYVGIFYKLKLKLIKLLKWQSN